MRSLLPRRRAIPTRTKKARVPAARRRSASGSAARPASTRPSRPRASPRRRATARPRSPRRPLALAEQPLGVGVGDAFALQRLNVPAQLPRSRQDRGVREIGWAEFGDLARQLAERIGGEFQPEVVLGVVNGGVFLGGALAATLKAELHTMRVEKRGKRVVVLDPATGVRGKKVLVADDVTHSGDTLAAVCAAARRAGATETRTATLVIRPDRHHSDFHALETRDLVVFGWDYQLHGSGPAGSGDPGEIGV